MYERALVHEFQLRGIKYQQQMPVKIIYKGLEIAGQKVDLYVEPGIVVELKSIEELLRVHTRQVVSYLKSTNSRLGLLINFSVTMLKDGIQRVIN